MTVLFNPELVWERHAQLQRLDREQIERRIGALTEPCELLSGGLANVNVRLGTDRVYRQYLREPKALGREAALLARRWSSLRVPRLLARGDDYLVLEYVPHAPPEDSALVGAAAGRALAEIHSSSYAAAGELDAALEVCEPYADVIESFVRYVSEATEAARGSARQLVLAEALGAVERLATHLRHLAAQSTLLHADFKASNLHWTPDNELLVLDWEFAYAGPKLMDLGQLTRWSPSPEFVSAFDHAYRAAGGELPDDWLRWAAAFDLFNLVGLLCGSETGTRREADISARILATVRSSG